MSQFAESAEHSLIWDTSHQPSTFRRHAGPAFIKWAQWSSSRPDLFPPDLCSRFERLQSSAPSHPGQLSVEVVQAAFEHLERQPLFESFELQPVASGSIAQVHRARLSPYGAAVTGSRPGQVVAVKVRHPGVTHIMQRDFVLMQRAAKLCGLLPGLSDLRLDESIRQFGGPLKEQVRWGCRRGIVNVGHGGGSGCDCGCGVFKVVFRDQAVTVVTLCWLLFNLSIYTDPFGFVRGYVFTCQLTCSVAIKRGCAPAFF